MNVLIINGHPGKKTFNHALADAFIKGAEKTKVTLKTLDVNNMNLSLGITSYDTDKSVPENIKKAQDLISWANHVVWVYPTWWADTPAMLKAFFEQVFVSGFAFKYLKSDKFVKWDKYLKGKTSLIISTMDSPPWFYRYFVGDPAYKILKYNLKFCGFKSVKRVYFGSVKISTEKQRKKWLLKAEQLGSKLR